MRTALRIAAFLSCLGLSAGAAAQDVYLGSSVRIGGNIEVSDPTDGPLVTVGGKISVDAPVHGSFSAAGGKIDLGPNATISGDASLAGGNLVVRGPIEGDLHVAGGQITIDGPVGGDASVAGGSLTLGPDARIAGKLRFRGGELKRDPAAQVAGGTSFKPSRAHRHEPTAGERFTRGWVWTAGLVVLAAILAGALPGPSQRLAHELRERPWPTVGLGLLALVAIPVAAVLFCITVIGIPIGVLAIIVYAALLLVGYVWLAVVVGALLLDRFKADVAAVTAWRVGAAVLAMLILAILVRVPYVGGFLKVAAIAVGVGMIVGAVMRRVRPPEAPVAGAA